MGEASVLGFGFDSGDGKKLRSICNTLGLRLRKVRPEEYGEPLGAFAGLASFTGQSGTAVGLPGEMLLFIRLSERQLDHFLNALRTARVGANALKAVLTETNAKWTAPELYAELLRERAAMRDPALDSQ